MLTELTVENLGIIKRAHLEFQKGMVAISGESGAGKSMLLGGLKLLLGGRADTNIIRKGADRASVDCVWSIDDPLVSEILEEKGAAVEDSELLVSRVIGGEGVRSRFTIGGRPSPTSAMDDIKSSLVEIHGQSDQIQLRDPAVQRQVLDSFGGATLEKLLKEYQTAYKAWRKLVARIKDLEENFSRHEVEVRYNRDLVSRFEELAPEAGEMESLQREIDKLSNLEEISEKLGLVANLLFPEDSETALAPLEQALTTLRRISEHDAELESLTEEIESALDPLEAKLGELETYISGVDMDDLEKLKDLEDRLFDLKVYAKPFGNDLDRAIAESLKAQKFLETAEDDLDLDALKAELLVSEKSLKEVAAKLTESRINHAADISSRINVELAGLAMGGTTFVAEVNQSTYGSHGVDEISFMVETKGSARRPITKAASGGELSRLMLALEVVVTAQDEKAITFVFDEIDTGVGGATAMEIGRRLAKLAEKHQVIVVTHLPQVAAWADSQLVISKDTSGEIIADVKTVVGQERIQEIARMLSGLNESETGLAHAEELLALTMREKANQ